MLGEIPPHCFVALLRVGKEAVGNKVFVVLAKTCNYFPFFPLLKLFGLLTFVNSKFVHAIYLFDRQQF